MTDLDDWLKAIVFVGLCLLFLVLASCQLFERNREHSSECAASCDDCKNLTLDCALNTERINKYTQNIPEDRDKEDEQK